MAWQGLLGVDEIALQFARANRRGRLGGSFLFVGPNGVGKRSFAFALAKTLLCRKIFPVQEDGAIALPPIDDETFDPAEELARFQPCGVCECCKQFEQNVDASEATIPTHPDFHYVCKPADRSLMPLELLIGEKNNRARSGLCYALTQTAFMGGRKIAIVDDADYFNQEGANALLKTLEEPPANSLIILIGTSATKQLPTIRSRCQIFRFKALRDDELADLLVRQGKVGDRDEALDVARKSNGSLTEAARVLDVKFAEFQATLMNELSRRRIMGVEFATKLNEFVDAAGKEAPLRRKRLKDAFVTAIEFYREACAQLNGERRPQTVAASYAKRWIENETTTMDVVIESLERTLEALEEVDRNANLPYIVEAWAYEIAKKTR